MKLFLMLPLLVLFAYAPPAEGKHAASLSPAADTAASLQVLSFNLRLNTPADSQDAWPHRKENVAQLIQFYRTDVMGVQEALPGMLEDLEEELPEFEWFGEGRDSTRSDEYSAIFYRPDRLELLSHDTFWLSETPEVPGSQSWDAALPRIVTWGRFRDRENGAVFYHFNTHFDHQGEEARRESAHLLLRHIEQIAGDTPVVVTGDFNADDTSQPYRILTGSDTTADDLPALHDAKDTSESGHYGPNSTWNGFEEVAPDNRIDFIFVRGDVRVLRHAILTDTWNGRFPSDHLPVLAEVVIE